MKFNYFDIHSHLNLKPLSEDVSAVIARMKEKEVGTITVGTGLATSQDAIHLAHQYPDLLWATVGIHPIDCDEAFDSESFENLGHDSKVVAVGETGLDYFRDQSNETKAKQIELFKKHIALAEKVEKPLMLHVRASKNSDDAYYDALEILGGYEGKANFHFFSGSKQCMEDIVSRGFTISVDGPITFSKEYDEMIRACPFSSLMVETDAPFAAPHPYRGKTCEPWMVEEVVAKIAEIKDLPREEVRTSMVENTQKFFGLSL